MFIDFNKYTFHLTLNEKRFVEESLKILSIRNPNIKQELDGFIESFEEPKDKVSCGQRVVNFLFKKRFPVISKKLKLLNKLKFELKQHGIKLSYDKMLEQNPKIVLMNGKEVLISRLETSVFQKFKVEKSEVEKFDKKVQSLIDTVLKIFYSGL